MPGPDRYERWCSGIGDELDYWRGALADPASEVRQRFDPLRLFRDPELVTHLARGGRLRVLDVGAGPITNLGYLHPDVLIHITAIDALADEFHALLLELDLWPPVVTIGLRGEELDRVLPAQVFDAAYCTNALDHCFDPLGVIDNMLRSVRVGGVVSMLHFVDEGSFEDHRGLHQWDLRLEDDRPVLATPTRDSCVDLLARYADQAEPVELRRWELPFRDGVRPGFTLRLRRTCVGRDKATFGL
ncbi:MAG: hypothetical protein R3F30_06445 [Planctomycetota bacterium]